MTDKASQLPVLPLRDVVVYPHMVIPLFVGRDKSINALERERKEKDAQIRSLREQVQRREISRNFGRAR